MGELVDLKAYRDKKEAEEIAMLRAELHRLMARVTMVGLVFASPIPLVGWRHTEPVPVEVPVQIS